MAKVSEEVAALEAVAEKLQRELDAERKRNAMYGAEPGPRANEVTFVGGPLDMTRRVLDHHDIMRGRYNVAIANPPSVFASPSDTYPGVFMGTYFITRFPLGFRQPYYVGLWEGVQ
jgi:hypothetical protein